MRRELDAKVICTMDNASMWSHAALEMLRRDVAVHIPNVRCDEWAQLNKFERYATYMRLFPEHDYIWLGGSGQGDLQQGVKVLFSDSDGHCAYITDVRMLRPIYTS